MTIEELNVLFYLRAELEWLNTVKAQLMDAATSTTAKLTGMPHGSGVTDKVGGLAAEIADLDSQIEQITAKSDAEEAQLADWIAGIRDPRTRLVFRLRFFRALSWKEIAKNNPHNDGHGKSHRVPIFERRNPLHTWSQGRSINMNIKQKTDTVRMKAARILVKALFAAASEDDAADPSSEKSGSVETDAKEQIKRLLDAEQA